MEKPKELYKHLKSFLIDPLPSPKHEKNGVSHKVDQSTRFSGAAGFVEPTFVELGCLLYNGMCEMLIIEMAYYVNFDMKYK